MTLGVGSCRFARKVPVAGPGSHRVALDQLVGLLSRHPRFDERKEDRFGEV